MKPKRPRQLVTIESLESRCCLSAVAFLEHEILRKNEGQLDSIAIHAADLDGDGDLDLIASDTIDSFITWNANLGNGEFSDPKPISSADDNWSNSVKAADIDADGDVDILSAGPEFVWFENLDGKGAFGDRRLITSKIMEDFDVSDLDGDDDLDVVGTDGTWYENDGIGNFEAHGLDHSGDRILATDIDGDNDNDIFIGRDFGGEVMWLENIDGKGDFFAHRNVAGPLGTKVQSIHAADMDGDGDADILASTGFGLVANSDGRLSWHENIDGKGTFAAEHVIYNEGTDGAFVADLDRDGDMDVVSSSSWFGTAWHENLDGAGTFGPPIVMSRDENFAIYGSVFPGDFDGDGDIDVISKTHSSIDWYESRKVGDSNNDGRFSSGDLVKVFQAGQFEDGIARNSTFAEGDWNGDGEFDTGDLVFAFQSGSFVAAAHP